MHEIGKGLFQEIDELRAALAAALRERDGLREAARRGLPNGWPRPTFMSSDEDSVSVEWCFGEQGAADSWRVSFSWNAGEGVQVVRTWRAGQEYRAENEGGSSDIGPVLDAWLRETKPPGAPAARDEEGTKP